MHQSSQDAMERALQKYVFPHWLHGLVDSPITVADIGSFDVNGTYRGLFDEAVFRYVGLDLEAGPNVDVVMSSPGVIPLESESQQLVISGQMLEHAPRFWEIFQEMTRVLAPGGRMIVIAPSGGPEHRYPVDCYRYLPDSFRALASDNELRTIDVRINNWGPWFDLVGVFEKSVSTSTQTPNIDLEPGEKPFIPSLRPLILREVTPAATSFDQGSIDEGFEGPFGKAIRRIIGKNKAGLILDLGPRRPINLSHLSQRIIVVEHDWSEAAENSPGGRICYPIDSDEYFETSHDPSIPIGFGLIHARRSVATLLRDFANVEENACPNSSILVLDGYPFTRSDSEPPANEGSTLINKLLEVLKSHRPELKVRGDRKLGNSLHITGLDPSSRWIRNNYSNLFR